MLILEDLDSLVTPQNRSYFLNEVDGFAKNTGILAVATANNPEHLDPALVNRPSRFDRRYAFDLPEAKERARYLVHFTSRLNPELRLAEADALSVVGVTQGFSYAYLKELVLSSMMSWIAAPGSSPFVDFLKANALQLGAQMALDPAPTPRVELSAFGEDD
jgi:ATP-dependent 26S proteasome regulatory subunit